MEERYFALIPKAATLCGDGESVRRQLRMFRGALQRVGVRLVNPVGKWIGVGEVTGGGCSNLSEQNCGR